MTTEPADFKVPLLAPAKKPEFEAPPPSDLPTCPYKAPSWSCTPDEEYSFEVLKNGQIIETVKDLQSKAFWSFGRLPKVNHIELAHPTISRFHAILQYRGAAEETEAEKKTPDPGWYIYDLGSTHGTFVNKQRVPVKTYVRLRVGYMLKMGASTRSFILLGPNEDQEDVEAESITEMKEQKQKAIEEILKKQEQQRLEEEEKQRAKEAEGISWGMADDAEDEPDLSVNPFSVTTNEELFLDDPKKTLRGFFEREGLDLEYKVEDLPNQTFLCKVELPLDDDNGRPIVAQFQHKGKKKDCVAQCALEACRILDKHGVLRRANQEARERRKKADSDSDNDDDFLDRTGDIQKRRKRKAQDKEGTALTYEELLQQEVEIKEKIAVIEEKIASSKTSSKKSSTQDGDEDDLDAFMSNLKQSEPVVDKVEIKKYRLEQQSLQKDLKQVQRLIEITRPLELPKLMPVANTSADSQERKVVGKDKLPLFGKKFKMDVKAPEKASSKIQDKPEQMDVEEFDEEEEEVTTEKDKTVEIKPQESVVDIEKVAKESVKEVEPKKVKHTEAKPTHEDPPEKTRTDEDSEATAQAKKKNRQRLRIRKQVRDNVDMEETAEEVEDKFTDWLPPSNQTGDGTTSLNEKLGY